MQSISSKAVDSVNHRLLLLAKFKGYGIVPTVMKWVESFLSRRTSQLNANGALSLMAKVISGVPQGSVIGPTLFVIYINDLPDRWAADSVPYADEAKFIALRNHRDTVQGSLNVNWYNVQYFNPVTP